MQYETAAGLYRAALEHLYGSGAQRQLDDIGIGDDVELHQQIRKLDIACRLVDDNAHRPFRRVCTNIDQSTGKSLVPHPRHRDQHLAVEISTPRRPWGGTCPYTLPSSLHSSNHNLTLLKL